MQAGEGLRDFRVIGPINQLTELPEQSLQS